MLHLDDQLKLRPGEEVSLTLYHSLKSAAGKSPQRKTVKKATKKAAKSRKPAAAPPAKSSSSRIRAKIAWMNKEKKQAGISFEGLTENNRKILEGLMRDSPEIS